MCGISRGGKSEKAKIKGIDLTDLAKAVSLAGYQPVNLQYDATKAELQDLRKRKNIEVIALPEINIFQDLDGLAALISSCEIVVSVENLNNHLAGSLVTNSFVLSPFRSNWRWGNDLRKSYWHESLTILKQSQMMDWSSPLRQLRSHYAMATLTHQTSKTIRL